MGMQGIARKALKMSSFTRAFSSSLSKRAEVPTQFLKIKEKQKAFGMNNGLRVHEKVSTDKAVMAFTQGMLAIGAVFWIQTVFTMAKIKETKSPPTVVINL